MKKKEKTIGAHMSSNRTIIGIVCIVLALVMCFGVAPLVNKLTERTTEVVRMTKAVDKGSIVTEDDVIVEKVGSFNLPGNVIKDKNEVVGRRAAVDLFAGQELLPDMISGAASTADDILDSMDLQKKAISITISSFAAGVSGKLETGDVVGVLVYDKVEDKCYTPAELAYLKVITTTTSQGIDKADVEDNTQPTTVTLLVNSIQAELLAKFEQTAKIHFVLECRGDEEEALQYLNEQDCYFSKEGV